MAEPTGVPNLASTILDRRWILAECTPGLHSRRRIITEMLSRRPLTGPLAHLSRGVFTSSGRGRGCCALFESCAWQTSRYEGMVSKLLGPRQLIFAGRVPPRLSRATTGHRFTPASARLVSVLWAALKG